MNNANSNAVPKTHIFDPDVGINTYLSGFRIDDAYYQHYINLEDDTAFIINDGYEILFEVDHLGYCKLNNADIGKFNFCKDQDDIWEFTFNDNTQENIVTGSSDLLKAEVIIFKTLSDRGVIKNG